MATNGKFAVIIPAAGKSTRFGGSDKLLADLAGQSVLYRAVALFAARQDVRQMVVATAPERMKIYRDHLQPLFHKSFPQLILIEGGAERWETVFKALSAVDPHLNYVAIHDAARPLTPQTVINEAFTATIKIGAAIPVFPEPATIKRIIGPDRLIHATIPRADLFQAQTPQCFSRSHLIESFVKLHAHGNFADVTDDAQVFEHCGLPVLGTPGSAINLKITTPEDLQFARALLQQAISGKSA